MGNLDLWNKVKAVPPEAQKTIGGGRLRGMTDINPMWRIMKLTELFGMVGFGWKYDIARQWMEEGAAGERCAFCNINLYVKHDGVWSDAIPGNGGSMLVENEKAGPHTSDECYKMALTDAISVACKALGVGADVYWSQGSKYTEQPVICPECGKPMKALKKGDGTIVPPEKVLEGWGHCVECHKKKAGGDAA